MDDPTNKPPEPKEPKEWHPADDGFDFEPTDLGDARRVLDEESITQFDVATMASPDHWKRLRRATLPTDRALTGRAIDWLLALPAGLRPHALSNQFPRIANHLAELWDDPEQSLAAVARLLNDGRRGRAGFPRDVQAEILALHDWLQPF